MAEKKPAQAKTSVPVTRAAAAVPTFWDLRRGVDSLFENFFTRGFPSLSRGLLAEPFERFERMGELAPSLDVAETATGYEVSAELPGMSESDIEVTVAKGMLTLKGEKKEEREEKKKNYYLSERRFGSVQRSVSLPEDVDEEKIAAKFDKGVLTVTLPKSAEAQKAVKKIKVAKA